MSTKVLTAAPTVFFQQIDDEVTGSDRFREDKGRENFKIARKHPKDPHSPIEIKNSTIAFSWHLMSEKNVTDMVKDKQFEILAYVS